MRIGITTLFNGSAFGGAAPQIAIFMSRVLVSLGHTVNFLLPSQSESWFIDCKSVEGIPVIKLENGSQIQIYDLVIEIVWFLPSELRKRLSQKSVMFYHYPAVFYDIESSTYRLNSQAKDFNGIDAIWTWSHFKQTDFQYLEFLSGKPVLKCPFLWDSVLIDSYCAEANIVPSNNVGSKIVICESNESNTSHCTIPLTIVSEIYRTEPSVQWMVLNSEVISKRPFFVSNILNNLHFGCNKQDISGNFLKRVRLPDLCREQNVILSHQRWRPLKYMLLDALYLGIPLIHNCELLKQVEGGKWFYELNRIGQAVSCWGSIKTEPRPSLDSVRRNILGLWGPSVFRGEIGSIIDNTMKSLPLLTSVSLKKFRIAFFDMWADFDPNHNLFVENLRKCGAEVEVDQMNPTIIIFGPFGKENLNTKWLTVPKIFYTGENIGPVIRNDVVLNIGFRRDINTNYIRMPNWMTELNWYNQDIALIKNPMPFDLSLLTSSVKIRSKFCAFVASNPSSSERNTLYNLLCRYKQVDSSGLLFNNMTNLKCGPGGSGGQQEKVEFYKQYKFALVCENSQSPGYVTEKLLHAKLAGCVPIYWGDPFVADEFNPSSFINANSFDKEDDFLNRIKEIDTNESEWVKIASQPILSEGRLDECKRLLNTMATAIVSVNSPIKLEAPPSLIKGIGSSDIQPYKIEIIGDMGPKVIVTCTNSKFIESAIRVIKSSPVPIFVWVWDVTKEQITALENAGAKRVIQFDTSWNPNWSDFWNPGHYAWKPLLLTIASAVFKQGTSVIYLDSGIEIVNSIEHIWNIIEHDDFFVCNMPENLMKTWSHPAFCRLLKMTEQEADTPQYSANIVGFKAGGKYSTLLNNVFSLACNPEIIVGNKWTPYSATCLGHRQDQSIISLVGIRANIKTQLLSDFVGYSDQDSVRLSGKPFYLHRGNWVKGPANNNSSSNNSSSNNSSSSNSSSSINSSSDCFNQCFLVNLEHRTDRLDKFKKFNTFINDRYTRIEAVYGKNIQMSKEIAHLFRNNDFKWKKSVMGCALSHYKIWKTIIESSTKLSLILEDDVVLDPSLYSTWSRISPFMPTDADVIFLGGVLPTNAGVLPIFTENVNEFFARVRMNGGKRYFHFCTYSYILTLSGARKLCGLIQEKGIFTSMDHMIVNHGELLNIYFTTPLLAGCFQDADPNYRNADFNNFNRVDKFDSDIWNNLDCFSDQEVIDVTKGVNVVYFEANQPKQMIDSEWLESIFSCNFTWVNSSSYIDPKKKVIIYYQHTTPVNVIEGWINRHMDCELYLLHASDEFLKADVSLYNHPGIKSVFRNYWRPDVASNKKVMFLPLGYLNGTRLSETKPINERKFTWSFAGAMDRPGRKAVIDNLENEINQCAIHRTPTWKSGSELPVAKYAEMLNESKFVPCLDGFFNVESYRFYESLEAGCLPFFAMDANNSYQNLLGTNNPLLGVKEWDKVGQIITALGSRDDILTKLQLDTKAWWSKFKNELTKSISELLFS